MNAIYWHMNATLGGVNLLPGANLHPLMSRSGANCAHEHGLRVGSASNIQSTNENIFK